MSNYWNDPGLVQPVEERRRSRFWLFFPFLLLFALRLSVASSSHASRGMSLPTSSTYASVIK